MSVGADDPEVAIAELAVANVNQSRRYFLIGATSAVGAAGVVGAAVPFVASWVPSAKARAAGAPITVDISKLEPGSILGPIPGWRGMPVFFINRGESALETLATDTDKLADADSAESLQPEDCVNSHRSTKPEVGIYLGICTHLGCSPKYNPVVEPQAYDENWRGGFYCPCHGSTFDLAGRVYSGVPAPTNLEVPPHRYEGSNLVVIGEGSNA